MARAYFHAEGPGRTSSGARVDDGQLLSPLRGQDPGEPLNRLINVASAPARCSEPDHLEGNAASRSQSVPRR